MHDFYDNNDFCNYNFWVLNILLKKKKVQFYV